MEGIMFFDIDSFISRNIIKRDKSLFFDDMLSNADELRDSIEKKSILVVGGGGTIGSSFIKTILPYKPASLVVIDASENNLAELIRDLRCSDKLFIPEDFMTYPMDYRDRVFEKMFYSRSGFDIVANFSAHKHVRSEKDLFSIETVLRNNAIDVVKLFDVLKRYQPEKFFCVSTDKAVNPVNIMGASKRIMEDLIFTYSDRMNITTARFANVAFSNGSLLASFIERINKKQPLAAPNDILRYFVSPGESGEICALSCMIGKNREIFFPKLDKTQMATFSEIATKLLEELGFTPQNHESEESAIKAAKQIGTNNNYPVFFAGSDTSGEKAVEEFYTKSEKVDLNSYKSLGVITNKKKTDTDSIYAFINDLCNAFTKPETKKEAVIGLIRSYLPNFKHIEKKKNLDSKM
jgi:FlaA1/EpsC-like NDP-sugar epimerase